MARSHYAVQGWRRERIYPDFIFAVRRGDDVGKSGDKLAVLEMKGEHLAGNSKTTYIQSVLRLMSEAFAVEQAAPVGQLELVVADGATVECDLVLMTEWPTKLPVFFA